MVLRTSWYFKQTTAGIYPDPPGGVITPPPSFHATPPQPSEVQGGVIRGVFTGGVYVIVMEGVKY